MEQPTIRMHPYFVKPRSTPSGTFTMDDLLKIYNIPPIVSTERRNIAIISFGGGLYGTFDANGTLISGDCVTYFQDNTSPYTPTVSVQFVEGATNQPNDPATVENTIDVQAAGKLMPNSNIRLFIAKNTVNSYQNVLAAISAWDPFVVNNSWGFGESIQATTYCQEIATLLKAFRDKGINVCCAAGDAGSNDGTTTPTADFPGSCPYVLTCGGTQLVCPNKMYDSATQETVWNNGPYSATGGGVSVIFDKESWQDGITGTKRMTPDVTGVGAPPTGVHFLINGQDQVIGGTSIVAPFFAGYLARIGCNQFVNEKLYKAPATCFHDIVTGNNGAYQAGKGFDMCSGWGSINGTVLQAHLMTSSVPVGVNFPDSLTFTSSTGQKLQCTLPNGVWSTSDASIATVSNTGLVTPVANGTCHISNTQATNLVNVTVSLPYKKPISSDFEIMPFLSVGSAMVLCANADLSTISWHSSNPKIASVTSGIVVGLSSGQCCISATNGSGTVSTFSLLVGSLFGA